MIIAGTISAYLKLSIEDFRSNLQEATRLLSSTALGIPPVSAGLAGMELAAYGSSDAMSVLRQSIGLGFAAAQRSAVSACTGMGSTVTRTASGIKNDMLGTIRSLREPLTAAMAAAGTGMEQGLRSKTASIVSAAHSIASQVTSAVRSALRIASPSKVMRRLGAFTSEGLALGITDGLPRVARSASAVARAVESGSAAVLTLPSPAFASPEKAYAPAFSGGEQESLDSLARRMDRLLDYLYDTEPVLRLDGRTFARMVREYS